MTVIKNKTSLYADMRSEVLDLATLKFPDWVEFSREELGEERWHLCADVVNDLDKDGLIETQSTFDAVRVRSMQQRG